MTISLSAACQSAVRALRGESDIDALFPAFADQSLAGILAVAPVHHEVRSIAALASGFLRLLSQRDRTSPALHDAMRRFIPREEGTRLLGTWASLAPPGWGAAHAHALFDAVRSQRCAPWVFAALVGPEEATASHLNDPRSIARAIRTWGCAVPNHPTWWTSSLSPHTLKRLTTTVQSKPFWLSFCLPWMPNDAGLDLSELQHDGALRAFAHASDASHIQWNNVLHDLVHRDIKEEHFCDLCRFAIASSMEEAWQRIIAMIQESPARSEQLLMTTPWEDLPHDVQTCILSLADENEQCRAIAYARGERDDAPCPSERTVGAFFAAVTRTVWDKAEAATRQAWLAQARPSSVDVAIRSLGGLPGLLACAAFGEDVIAALQRHVVDDEDVRALLLPLAIRNASIRDAYALIANMPPLPDISAFTALACGSAFPLRETQPISPTIDMHGAATRVTLSRMARMHGDVAERCLLLETIFAGQSWEEATATLEVLDDAERRSIFPDRHDARWDILRQLPPDHALPALHAIAQVHASCDDNEDAWSALSSSLRDHGETFLAIVDAMDIRQRDYLLPLPRSNRLATALRALAMERPQIARHLAIALKRNESDMVALNLAEAPREHRRSIWQSLGTRVRAQLLGDVASMAAGISNPDAIDALRSCIERTYNSDPDMALIIRLLACADTAACDRAILLLKDQRPSLIRCIAPLLNEEIRRILTGHFPAILVDLTETRIAYGKTQRSMLRRHC